MMLRADTGEGKQPREEYTLEAWRWNANLAVLVSLPCVAVSLTPEVLLPLGVPAPLVPLAGTVFNGR